MYTVTFNSDNPTGFTALSWPVFIIETQANPEEYQN